MNMQRLLDFELERGGAVSKMEKQSSENKARHFFFLR